MGRYNAATSRETAGWALALSLLIRIPFGFLVAIGLAIAVLVRSNEGGDHGKGRAIAALVVSGMILVTNVIYVVVMLVDVWRNGFADSARTGRVVSPSPAWCRSIGCAKATASAISRPPRRSRPASGPPARRRSPAHGAARLRGFAIVPIDTTAYVDQRSLDRASARTCLKPFREYVGRSFQRSVYELNYDNPAVDGASLLENKVVCMVTDPDGPRTTMMESSARWLLRAALVSSRTVSRSIASRPGASHRIAVVPSGTARA